MCGYGCNKMDVCTSVSKRTNLVFPEAIFCASCGMFVNGSYVDNLLEESFDSRAIESQE